MTAKLDLTDCPTPFWLPSGHLQTIYSANFARHHRIALVRQRLTTPDGDFVDLDWTAPGLFSDKLASGATAPYDAQLNKTAARRWMDEADWDSLPKTPHTQALVLFHGLEGSSSSHYAQAITQYFRSRGWIVVVAHFRGCSGFPNRMARAYYSGDSDEIKFILDSLKERLPLVNWYAVGVSLGANALLKYLGEQKENAQWLKKAAAISAPTDLVSCGNQLSDSLIGKKLYCSHFLKTMRKKIFEKSRRFPGMIDSFRLSQAQTIRDFDDIYTAPMHGYQDALDYWTQASSKPLLPNIAIPTLVLNAKNDPFIPVSSLPEPHEVSEQVLLHQPERGGHVGFTTGAFPGHIRWLPARLAQFYETNS